MLELSTALTVLMRSASTQTPSTRKLWHGGFQLWSRVILKLFGKPSGWWTFSILEWSSWCKLFLRQIQEVGMDRMTQWLFERKAQVHVIVLVAGLWWLVYCGYRGCTICCLWLDWQFALTQTAVEIPRFVWREWAFQSIQTALLPALSFHQNPEHSNPGLWNVTHVAPHQSMFSWGDEWLV